MPLPLPGPRPLPTRHLHRPPGQALRTEGPSGPLGKSGCHGQRGPQVSIPGELPCCGQVGREVSTGAEERDDWRLPGAGGGAQWGQDGLQDWPKGAPPASSPRPCAWPAASSWLRLPAKPLYLAPHTAPQSICLYRPSSRGHPSPRGPACPGAGVLLVVATSRPSPGASLGRAACLHGAVCLAWAGVGETIGLLSRGSPPPPRGGAPLAPCPTRPGWRPAAPGWDQLLPASPATSAPAPRRPLSMLVTPDLLAYFPSLARHNPASLARMPPIQVGCPTVFPRGSPLLSHSRGAAHRDTVPWLEGLGCVSRQSLPVHLGMPNIWTS